jgi:hypothetical protein
MMAECISSDWDDGDNTHKNKEKIENKLGISITPYFQFVVQLCD